MYFKVLISLHFFKKTYRDVKQSRDNFDWTNFDKNIWTQFDKGTDFNKRTNFTKGSNFDRARMKSTSAQYSCASKCASK